MGCFFIELNRLGNTPTPTIERVGATPTAELDYQPCKRTSDGVEGFWDCVTQTFIAPRE